MLKMDKTATGSQNKILQASRKENYPSLQKQGGSTSDHGEEEWWFVKGS